MTEFRGELETFSDDALHDNGSVGVENEPQHTLRRTRTQQILAGASAAYDHGVDGFEM